MADKTITRYGGTPGVGVPIKALDQGDGTYAEAISVVDPIPAGTNNIGDVDVLSIAAGENHIGEVGGRSTVVSAEKTRPANTTGYTANDAIGDTTNWAFAVGRTATGSGTIVAATVASDQAAETETLELDLYNANPTDIADNAEATRLYANQANFVGTVSFGVIAKKTANSNTATGEVTNLNLPFKCSAASSIYGVLRTSAFTPASGAKYRVNLSVLQD